MRNAFLLLLLVAPALAAHAQGTPVTRTFSGDGSQNCPIVASAQRWASSGLALAGKPGRTPDNATLYLHFNATGGNKVVAARIVLHGTTAAPRAELAGGVNTGDLSESRDLNGDLRDTSVALSKIVNVRWLSIAELRYADGTTWHESGQAYCHITPNGFRLVGAPVH
ncbi:MAG TPA: hypothetical protein VGN16_19230 [Acidobacteriaceae bacterium]|jgi:hypothetical protein